MSIIIIIIIIIINIASIYCDFNVIVTLAVVATPAFNIQRHLKVGW